MASGKTLTKTLNEGKTQRLRLTLRIDGEQNAAKLQRWVSTWILALIGGNTLRLNRVIFL